MYLEIRGLKKSYGEGGSYIYHLVSNPKRTMKRLWKI